MDNKFALFDLNWMHRNPATVVLQFLSHMISGTAKLLQMVFRILGFETWAAYAAHEPEGARYMRAMCRCCSSWVRRRHIDPFTQEFPALLGIIADPDSPWSEKLKIAQRVKPPNGTCENCFDPQTQALSKAVQQWSELVQPHWRLVLYNWSYAYSLCLTIADIERIRGLGTTSLGRAWFGAGPGWSGACAPHLSGDKRRRVSEKDGMRRAPSFHSMFRTPLAKLER